MYWDFAYNLDGERRSRYEYGIEEHSFQDSNTWLAGLQIGELKRRGDWYVSADYRQYGVSSIDPNLNDPNFALSRLNTQGFRINLGYNLTDWLKAEVWYYGAWNLDKNIHSLSGTELTASTIKGGVRRQRGAEPDHPVDGQLLAHTSYRLPANETKVL